MKFNISQLQIQSPRSQSPLLGMGTRGGRLSLPCGATAGDLLSSVPSRSSNCDLDYDLYRDDFPYR